MTTNILTYGLIAKRAVTLLENNIVFANQVYRGYEDEYSKNQNGYKPGDTITVRRPIEANINDGPVAVLQDNEEGSLQIKVNLQKNAAFAFTSKDMTLDITDFEERFIKPRMIKMAQQIDQDVATLVKDIPNWVGTPGAVLSNFDSFSAATQRLDDTSIGSSPRTGILSPRDARGLQANLTGPQSLFAPDMVSKVYQKGALPPVDGVELFKSQNTPTIMTGSRTTSGGGTLNGGTLATTWSATKDTNTMTLTVTSIGGTVSVGEVFTLAGVFDVNPVSKIALPYLKQFTIVSAGTGTPTSMVVSPPIIVSGPYQNVSAAPAPNAAITWMGAASTAYTNNIVFNKNAFCLVMVPMEKLEGGVKTSRMSRNGFSIRVSSGSDITNDKNIFRLDVLYGIKTIDPRQAVRLSGT